MAEGTGGEIVADFVQTMKDWRRMCDTIQSKNQKTSIGDWCKGCPLQGLCIIDTSIKDSTNGEFDIIGEQIQAWAADHPEPVYPTWLEWLEKMGIMADIHDRLNSYKQVMEVCEEPLYSIPTAKVFCPIPADIAQKLGIEPKEG